MSLKTPLIALTVFSLLLISAAGPAIGGRTVYLGVCQELVSQARAYEARANYHSQIAKSLTALIESQARLPKNAGTIQTMDNLFNQYDENRELERKFRELFRKASSDADQCMKNAE
ncbi:MAG: hypothetical protein LDL33_10565 [Desulfomonile sp.]|nr:hypothetical protein [Desulfomonile sp.]